MVFPPPVRPRAGVLAGLPSPGPLVQQSAATRPSADMSAMPPPWYSASPGVAGDGRSVGPAAGRPPRPTPAGVCPNTRRRRGRPGPVTPRRGSADCGHGPQPPTDHRVNAPVAGQGQGLAVRRRTPPSPTPATGRPGPCRPRGRGPRLRAETTAPTRYRPSGEKKRRSARRSAAGRMRTPAAGPRAVSTATAGSTGPAQAGDPAVRGQAGPGPKRSRRPGSGNSAATLPVAASRSSASRPPVTANHLPSGVSGRTSCQRA